MNQYDAEGLTDDVRPIMVVEDDTAILELLCEELQDAGYPTLGVDSAEQALAQLSHSDVALIICDIRLPGMDGMSLLEQLRQNDNPIGFIVITAFGTIDQAVDALKLGANDFLTKPLDLENLRTAVFRVLEHRRLANRLRQAAPAENFHGLTGNSESMRSLFHNAARLADSDAPLLILGESGTGKELMARALHAESTRHDGPFVAVNCASIPAELMESECFGHVKGAFTGAQDARQGLFQSARNGSLFLDEIGEMPMALQAKLLRALQERKIRPVGAEREEPIDVRIIAATHRDLEHEIQTGGFRSDLFYRLETFSLRIPPLRERPGDVEKLIMSLLDKHTEQQGKSISHIEPMALQALLDYDYPGNVRELENAIIRAVTLTEDGQLHHDDLPERIRRQAAESSSGTADAADMSTHANRNNWPSLEEVERRYIHKVLDATGGNKRRTADLLGIARRTLYRRLGETSDDSR